MMASNLRSEGWGRPGCIGDYIIITWILWVNHGFFCPQSNLDLGGGGDSNLFWERSPRKFGEDEPILTIAHFSDGLVKTHQPEEGWEVSGDDWQEDVCTIFDRRYIRS